MMGSSEFLQGFLVGAILAGAGLSGYRYVQSRSETVHEIDSNYDGLSDITLTYRGVQTVSGHEDRNYDAATDIWHRYEDGELVESESDDDFNGTNDTRCLYAHGQMARVTVDLDEDGAADVVEHYEYSILTRQVWLDASGRPHRETTYRKGIPHHSRIDLDRSGQFDMEIAYTGRVHVVTILPGQDAGLQSVTVPSK